MSKNSYARNFLQNITSKYNKLSELIFTDDSINKKLYIITVIYNVIIKIKIIPDKISNFRSIKYEFDVWY